MTLAFLAIACSLSSVAQGGATWDGGGSDDYWTNGFNWNPAIGMFQFPPPNNGSANIVMPAVTGLVQTPIVDVPYSINSLTFNSDGGNGRFVILGVEELTIGAGGITNNDVDIQSFFGSLKLSANQTWNAATGPLQMDAVNLNGFELRLYGAHPMDLPSLIVGSGSLVNSNTATVTMSGGASNTYAGETSVHGGTLRLQKTGGATAVPGDLFLHGGGNVLLAGNEQIAHASGNAVWLIPGSGAASLNLNGYTETINELHVANGNSTSSVTTGAGTLKIGQLLEVVGSASTITGNLSLGDVSTFVHLGGEISANNNIIVGDSGDGTLFILTDGDVSNGASYIGNQSGSTGEVTVDGSGSTWINNGVMFVGNGGAGTLNVAAGGSVSSNFAVIGAVAGSNGHVAVDGDGSAWTNVASLTLVNGTLDITDSSQVTVGGNTTVLPASQINVSNGVFDANGTLTIDGGSLTADANAVVSFAAGTLRNGASVIVQNGASVTHTGTLDLVSDVTMQVDSGATYTTDFTRIGTQPGPAAELIVDGANTLVSSTSCCIDVGYGGAGMVTVTGGARVETPTGAVGSFGPGSVGTVVLDGTDIDGNPSTWSTAALNMGLSATSQGTLRIRNGALFRSTAAVYGLAVGTPGAAQVYVEGTDAEGNPSLLDTALLTIGAGGYGNGAGEVTVSNGGRIEAGNIELAPTGGTATLTVTDPGSMLVQSGAATMTVGHATEGMAVLNVQNNATLTSGTGAINVYATGEINLESGAVFDARGPINMNGGQFNFLGGTLHVDDFNGNLLNEGGVLAPGHSAGATAISGNYTQRESATLEIEIGAVFPGEWDTLAVSGNAALDGVIEVKLVDGFEPVLGNSFTILTTDVGNVGGVFETEILPAANGVTFDVVYNPKSVVLTAVPALPVFTADFDEDGDVDADDLAQWQGDFGANNLSDADDDGDSDGADFLAWQQQLGGGVPAIGASAVVPEPCSLVLAGVSLGIWSRLRFRRLRRRATLCGVE